MTDRVIICHCVCPVQNHTLQNDFDYWIWLQLQLVFSFILFGCKLIFGTGIIRDVFQLVTRNERYKFQIHLRNQYSVTIGNRVLLRFQLYGDNSWRNLAHGNRFPRTDFL